MYDLNIFAYLWRIRVGGVCVCVDVLFPCSIFTMQFFLFPHHKITVYKNHIYLFMLYTFGCGYISLVFHLHML